MILTRQLQLKHNMEFIVADVPIQSHLVTVIIHFAPSYLNPKIISDYFEAFVVVALPNFLKFFIRFLENPSFESWEVRITDT